MSSVAPATGPLSPFVVHSIHFDFPGGQAIGLLDPVNNSVVGGSPEWIADPSREELVAYVRASRPAIRVVFRGSPSANGTHVVGANGTLFQVDERRITLAFDPASTLSQPTDFQVRDPLPDQIGLHSAKIDWFVRDRAVPTICVSAGTSFHRICTTWRAMTLNSAQGLLTSTYKPLVEWTCRWCAGQNDEKEICDAIIRNLPSSGLCYGVKAYDVPRMLKNGGGMCEGWYQMFQQMAHCQGAFVFRRCFLVHWRTFPNAEEQWCAIVVRVGGLNQLQPTVTTSEFHDNDTAFPLTTPVALVTRLEQRYRFWGDPIGFGDGHCINFLEHHGRLYLYDACFGVGPCEVDPPLPPDDFSVMGGLRFSSFKTNYLNQAVEYMLGSLYNGGILCRTIPPTSGIAAANGMTVRTTQIPDVVDGNPGITFFWGG